MESRFYITAGNGNFVFINEQYATFIAVSMRVKMLKEMKCTAIHAYDRYLNMEITELV